MVEINYAQEYIDIHKKTIHELLDNVIKLRTDLVVTEKTRGSESERLEQLKSLLQGSADRNNTLEETLRKAEATISTLSEQLKEFDSIKAKANEAGAFADLVRTLKKDIAARDAEIAQLKSSQVKPKTKVTPKKTVVKEDTKDGGEF